MLTVDLIKLLKQLVGNVALLVCLFINIQIILICLHLWGKATLLACSDGLGSFFAVSRQGTGSFTTTILVSVHSTARAKLVKVTSLKSISWLLLVHTWVLAVVDLFIESLAYALTEGIHLLIALDLKNLLLVHLAASVRAFSMSCWSGSLLLWVLANVCATTASLAPSIKLIDQKRASVSVSSLEHAVDEHGVLELILILAMRLILKLLFVDHVLVHLEDLSLLSCSNSLIQELIKVLSGSSTFKIDSLLPSHMVGLITHIIF